MNPIILTFADGTIFFFGIVLTSAAGWGLVRPRGRVVRGAASVAVLVGVFLVVLSATPAPGWHYAVWLALAAAVLVAACLARQGSGRARFAAVSCLTLMSLVLLAREWPYRRAPALSVPAETTVFVLGDSLSAGLNSAERTWPAVLADVTGLRVVNLARPGAGLEAGLEQARHVTGEPCLVMIELGGNDLLGGGDSGEFRRSLEQLLRGVTRGGARTVALFELPLPPFANAFGAAQREMAEQHGVVLIPKRVLARALGSAGGTVDGLHLSPQGHAALGRAVAELIVVPDGPEELNHGGHGEHGGRKEEECGDLADSLRRRAGGVNSPDGLCLETTAAGGEEASGGVVRATAPCRGPPRLARRRA